MPDIARDFWTNNFAVQSTLIAFLIDFTVASASYLVEAKRVSQMIGKLNGC